jgi:phosphatidylserine/phosphatidylglycerophosphate/cardiolipin synthase-like enzyme
LKRWFQAKERGVDVRLIADKTTPCERGSRMDPLAVASVPIWIDDQARIAHTKTMVIDGAVTLTGSINWTNGAARNSEDLDLVASETVAAAYATHWRERLAVSVWFGARTGAGLVNGNSARRTLMSELRPPARMRRVTVSVPEDQRR